MTELRFVDLPGWEADDHEAALACFRISARRMAARPYTTKLIGIDAAVLAGAGAAALAQNFTG
ncbi:MAG: transglycosylase, partial [Nitratireductor sp.]|nr:transglycosylase [Nitratireductor sp.]